MGYEEPFVYHIGPDVGNDTSIILLRDEVRANSERTGLTLRGEAIATAIEYAGDYIKMGHTFTLADVRAAARATAEWAVDRSGKTE